MTYPEGADLSSHDGNTSLSVSGLQFVIVKRTESVDYVNPLALQQIADARSNGLLVGHYHFFTLYGSRAPQAQADHFCDVVGQLRMGDIGVFVDLEAPGDHPRSKGLPVDRAAFLADYHTFIDRIVYRLARVPIIYTYPYYWHDQLGNPTDFADTNPLWLAAYSPTPPNTLPGGWKSVMFHQWTDKGKVPGIRGGAGPTDCDRFMGTMDELRQMAGLGAPPPPPQPPTPQPDTRFFPETGHNLSHGFLSFWNANGGLPMFGYPITEEIQEDGQTVQYFERARFEYVPPDNAGGAGMVRLGLVGKEAAIARGIPL